MPAKKGTDRRVLGSFLVSIFLVLAASNLHAATVLMVDGTTDSGVTMAGSTPTAQAAAVAFSLNTAISNVTITADVTCVLTCSGGVFLHQNAMGPGVPFGDTLFSGAFPTTTSLSLASLAAGNYFLVYLITAGTAVWDTTSTPNVTSNNASVLGTLFADDADAFAPRSVFQSLFRTNLKFSVSGTRPVPPVIAAVPLPGTGGFLVLSLILAWAFGRNRNA